MWVDGKFSQVVLSANAGDVRDPGSMPGSWRSPGGGHGSPLQCSCLENPTDKRTWQAIIHRVAKSWTDMKWLTMYTCTCSGVIQYFYTLYFIKCYYKIMAVISCAVHASLLLICFTHNFVCLNLMPLTRPSLLPPLW